MYKIMNSHKISTTPIRINQNSKLPSKKPSFPKQNKSKEKPVKFLKNMNLK